MLVHVDLCMRNNCDAATSMCGALGFERGWGQHHGMLLLARTLQVCLHFVLTLHGISNPDVADSSINWTAAYLSFLAILDEEHLH